MLRGRYLSLFQGLMCVLLVALTACGSGGSASSTVVPVSPAVSLSVSSLAFGSVLAGSSAAVLNVTLTNTGNGPLTLSGIAISGTNAGSFSQTNTCGASVAAGGSCTISAGFAPTASGSQTASLTISDNATNSPQTIALTGTGTAPAVTLSRASLAFTANLGTTAAAQTVTLSNAGTAPLTISGITLAGTNAASFSQMNTCGTSLAAGANCSISVSFVATVAGTYAANLTVADNASGSPQTVALAATETAPIVSLSPSSLSFSTPAGSSSTAQTVTLTNTGNGALNLGSAALTGANASSFADTTTCGATVAAGASCALSVVFSPAAGGSFAASIALTDNAANSPQAIALTGTGTVPVVTLNVSSLAFLTNVATASIPQTITLTNSGGASLNLASIALGGANASVFTQTNTCGTTIAAGASCSLTLTFIPTVAGNDVASLTITDNAAASPQTIALTGTATAPVVSLSGSALSFTTPAESTSASQTVTLSNTGNGALNLASIALGGTNAASFNESTTCGSALAPGASCAITVSLTAYLAMSYSASVTISSNAPVKTLALTGTGTGTITLNTANAADWVIANGAVTLDFDPAQFHIFGIHLAGDSNNLVDVTNISSRDGKPLGFYMGNQGLGTGTLYTGSKQVGNAYLDFWVGEQSNSTNFLTYEEHFIVTANDPGFHTYYVVHHSATDITGELSLVLWQFRTNLALFTHSYQVNTGLNNLGAIDTPLPSPYNAALNDAGRQVQNAVVDLHGITDSATEDFIATSNREFYTKYDFSTYEYLHQEHGVYGTQYGAWCVLPRTESIAGGPSKQDVDTLNQLIQQEMSGAHYVGTLNYVPPQGVDSTKLYGPVYFHFNQFNATSTTPAGLYKEAQTWLPWFDTLYDNDATLLTETYVPSTGRGTVAPAIANGGSATPYKAWVVLSDPATNFQWSGSGNNYWAGNNAGGTAQITGVDPGTYRLSAYVLGQWGELRQENVVVAANQTTTVGPLTFTPENFGTAAPVWTIGTPDRSAHEFLHGHDAGGNDFRNYQGAFNFWADFAANQGLQVYYATAVGNTPATNDLNQINYVQWGTFDPGLYAGIYNAADDTTDGYNYIVPAYVGAANVATQKAPGLNIHFATTAAQAAQGQYAVLSAGLAGVEGSFVATLNGHQLIWHVINESDPMVRSGLSGYFQWVAFEWPESYLNAPGADNVLTLGVSQIGVMMDALRFEITNKSSDPAVTGWHDYEYVSGSKYTGANDAVPNN